jgi:hypothetical protein
VFERALLRARDRFGCRVVHFSVQGNHLHLVCEAEDARCLARGMKGLAVRLALGWNRVMRRRGRVFMDRYHAHVLRTPAEVRNAIPYAVSNYASHANRAGRPIAHGFVDQFSSCGSRRPLCSPGGLAPLHSVGSRVARPQSVQVVRRDSLPILAGRPVPSTATASGEPPRPLQLREANRRVHCNCVRRTVPSTATA